MMEVGSNVPNLDLEDSAGKTLTIRDLLTEGDLVMYFMRTTTCPVCNHHVKDLMRRKDELDARSIRVIVAVPESRDAAAKWKDRQRVTFTVVTGRGSVHESVGLNKKIFGTMQQSGTLVVSRSGRVEYLLAATMPTASYDQKALDSVLAQLSN